MAASASTHLQLSGLSVCSAIELMAYLCSLQYTVNGALAWDNIVMPSARKCITPYSTDEKQHVHVDMCME